MGCWKQRWFFDFLGSDLLTLTREDLVQICGPADGIRLFNALKSRCVCACIVVCVHLCQANSIVMFCVCLCRSVRPRLTVYICQESPVVKRHGTNENGENSIAPGLHGKKKKFQTLFLFCVRLPFISVQCIMLCIWRSSQLQNWFARSRVCATFH